MATNALTKRSNFFPVSMDDFFKPWNNWFDNNGETKLTVPAVNVTEAKHHYHITVAAPGMKKEDFHIDVNRGMLTISAEAEESKEDKDRDFTRREYNYASFSRSFSLPDEVNEDKIEATYEDGVLKLSLPKKEGAKQLAAKSIPVK